MQIDFLSNYYISEVLVIFTLSYVGFVASDAYGKYLPMKKTNFTKLTIFSLIKIFIIFGILQLTRPGINDAIATAGENSRNILITMLGLLMAGIIPGVFAPIYNRVDLHNTPSLLVAKLVRGLLLLGIGLILFSAASAIVPDFTLKQLNPIAFLVTLVYMSIVFYDYWDLINTFNQDKPNTYQAPAVRSKE